MQVFKRINTPWQSVNSGVSSTRDSVETILKNYTGIEDEVQLNFFNVDELNYFFKIVFKDGIYKDLSALINKARAKALASLSVPLLNFYIGHKMMMANPDNTHRSDGTLIIMEATGRWRRQYWIQMDYELVPLLYVMNGLGDVDYKALKGAKGDAKLIRLIKKSETFQGVLDFRKGQNMSMKNTIKAIGQAL